MTIRVLAPADAPAYRALRARALREEPEAFSRSEPESLAELETRFADPERFTLGAFAPELVGFVSYAREDGAKVAHKGWLLGLYVAPEARGQGIGRGLCAELVRRAREIPGLEQLLLGVGAGNAPAQAVYAGLGFRRYGVEPHAVKIGGRYVDEDLMALALQP